MVSLNHSKHWTRKSVSKLHAAIPSRFHSATLGKSTVKYSSVAKMVGLMAFHHYCLWWWRSTHTHTAVEQPSRAIYSRRRRDVIP